MKDLLTYVLVAIMANCFISAAPINCSLVKGPATNLPDFSVSDTKETQPKTAIDISALDVVSFKFN